MNSDFVDKLGQPVIYPVMYDENEISIIEEKQVRVGNIGKILRGESNSQLLLFQMDKYYDNIDVTDKDIEIVYTDCKGNTYRDSAVNVSYNECYIRFNWLLSSKVTYYAGKGTASIHFIGQDDLGNPYVIKTANFYVEVEDAIEGNDIIVTAPDNWFIEVNNRLDVLEKINAGGSSGGTAQFVGTLDEFRRAYSNGLIKDGMIVNIYEEDIDPIDLTQTT